MYNTTASYRWLLLV